MQKVIHEKTIVILIIIFSCLLFSPSLFIFFSGDDWFHLRLVQIHSLPEFLNFFSFIKNDQIASFYRPLSTQLLFFLLHSAFALQPLFYHMFGIFIFGISLWLIYCFIRSISREKDVALITFFLYGISVTHFTRLYFISAFQEIIMVIFVLLSVIFYIKKNTSSLFVSVVFFILALLSKETAVVLPLILLMTHFLTRQKITLKLTPYFILLIIFLFLRLIIFPKTEGESYIWDFNILKMFNTLFWYSLWSIGAPEFLVDFVGSGLKIVPRFFEVFPIWSYVILSSLFVTMLSLITLIVISRKYLIDRIVLFSLSFFIIGLLPVLFLPWHKFSLELTLPLIGFCLGIAFFLDKLKKNILKYLFLGSFVLLNLISYSITYKTHYSISRAKISENVVTYLNTNYPKLPENSYFVFKNNAQSSKEWGVSKQIAQSISFADLFKVVYKNREVMVYFEDIPFQKPSDKKAIELDSLQFLK